MGYCISLNYSEFSIKKENINEALKAVKRMPTKEYSWVSKSWKTLSSLEEVMYEWRYGITHDDEGNIDGIHFSGEKIGDEIELFNALGPFVEEGSYLEMSGEDGSIWRWSFDGKRCKEISPQITWK